MNKKRTNVEIELEGVEQMKVIFGIFCLFVALICFMIPVFS